MEGSELRSAGDYRTVESSAEDERRLKSVLDIFTRLSIACKSRALYSADHPTAADAVTLLHAVMEASLRDNPLVKVEVGRDTLIYEQWVLGQRMEGLRALASRIRSLNIQEIIISAGAARHEVEALVEMLAMSPEALEGEGGPENFLLARGIHNLAVVESEARRASDEEGGGSPAGGTAAEQAPEHVDLGAVMSPELSDELLELLLDPEELARTLMALEGEEGEPLGKEELAAAACEFLSEAAAIIRQSHPARERECLRCMAEALLFLDIDVRDLILLDHLLPRLHEDPLCPGLLGKFNPQEIADVFSALLPLRPELVPEMEEILKYAGLGEGDSRRALTLLHARLVDLGQLDPSLLALLASAAEGDYAAMHAHEQLPTLEEVLGVLGEYESEELDEVRVISLFDPAEDTPTDTTPMLIDLLRRGSALDNPMKAVELLQNNLWGLTMAAELDEAALALEGVAEILRGGDAPPDPLRGELERLLEEMADVGVMERVARMACTQREQEDAVNGLRRYANPLGERGSSAMVEVLGTAEEMSVRKCLIDALTELYRGRIPALARHLHDERWYLVRNIVSIMGRIRSPEALPYLGRTLGHPNPKVRMETVRSAGLIGGPQASDLLMQGLLEEDEETRMLCVRWLGRLGETRAVTRLVNMLEGKEPGGESLRVKKEIIKSLGEIKSPECSEVLIRFKAKRKRLGRAEWRELSEAAEASLRRLTQTFPHLRRGK